MSFQYPWVLPFCFLPLVWAAWLWRGSARRGALLLKALSLTAVILAVARPQLTTFAGKVALAVLVDTSRSVSPEDLKRASELATDIERGRGRNWTRVLPFAKAVRRTQPQELDGKSWKLNYTQGPDARGTDLEAAFREAVATLPVGMVPRVVLISDGKENLGSAARGAWQAQQLGIPVDTVSLAGRPAPRLRVESVSLPTQVFSGERFPMDVTVQTPHRSSAEVEITAEGKALGVTRVQLEPGVNHFRVHARVAATGAIDLAGRIRAPDLGEAGFEYAVTLRRPKALLISQDPPGTEVHLLKVLEANQFEVDRAAGDIPEELDAYQLVVFNNWDAESVPAVRQAGIENYVKNGGGLLWIAGERNIYVEKKIEDPLARTLPARLAPPRTPEGTCVVLIVDKSSSMEGRKMELARLAAIGVIDNLRPIDLVGVLIFDNSFQWAVPIRRAEDRSLIKRLVAGVMADGGTQIAPALAEAYRRILPVNAIQKHIVLLTDGISEEGDSLSVSRDAADRRITISTVGLGQDVNKAYLEKVALTARGKSYFLTDPAGLEQILLKDVQEHTGSTAVERVVRVSVARQAEIIEGVGIEKAPPLRGYIRYLAKPTSETILQVDHKDPLLARWQYQLGRAAVFTSDAKARWASAWVGWEGFDKLWANILHDLLPHTPATEAVAQYDSANDELVVDYRLARHVAEPSAIPDIFVFGPGGFQSPVKVAKLAAGSYRGRVAAGRRQGLFRVRPLKDAPAFPEVGLYLEEAELSDYGSNDFLLKELASATGGKFNPRVPEMFDSGGRTVASVMELWPGLLALAIALNMAELILRKWRGVLESLRRQEAAEGLSLS
ncbi:MAG: VWA domain-containing protein [Bryobacterales bacterium]|nr:VWA domain-containing protein [Bryobacterales bacterium]